MDNLMEGQRLTKLAHLSFLMENIDEICYVNGKLLCQYDDILCRSENILVTALHILNGAISLEVKGYAEDITDMLLKCCQMTDV